MATRPPEVFVSYAREDATYKDALVRSMWEWAIPAWSDEEIQRGREFPRQLRERIESAATFVLLMSPDSRASTWVADELDLALDAGVPVFPLLLGGEPFERVAPRFQYDVVERGEEPSPTWFRQLVHAAGIGDGGAGGPDGQAASEDGGQARERLYGRAHEVRMLRDALVSPRRATIFVRGFAGTGKTSVVRAALRCMGAYLERRIWVDAGDVSSVEALDQVFERALAAQDDMQSDTPLVIVLDGVSSQLLGDRAEWPAPNTGREAPFTRAKLVITGRGAPRSGARGRPNEELVLEPFPVADSLRLLEALGIDVRDLAAGLADEMGGNPWLLTLAAEQLLAGQTPDRLADSVADDIRAEIDGEGRRLAPLERSLVQTLALACEPVARDEVRRLVEGPDAPARTRAALDGLQDSGWLTGSVAAVSLSPVIGAAVRRQTLADMAAELASGRFDLAGDHRLISTASTDAVQRRQQARNLRPLLDELGRLGRTVRTCLDDALSEHQLGRFAIGNLLNLVVAAGEGLDGADLAGQRVAEADLRAVQLRNVSFREAEFERVLMRLHIEGIISLAVDEGCTIVAAGAADGRLHVFSPADGALLATVAAHGDVVTDAAFNQAGTLLVTASDDETARLWDTRDWSLVRALSASRGLTTVAVDAAADRVAAGGYARTVWMWDRHSGGIVWSQSLDDPVSDVAFGPGEDCLAVGTRAGVVEIWDTVQNRLLLRTAPIGGPISSIGFEDTRGVIVSSADARATTRWDLASCSNVERPPHPLDSLGLTFSEDASLVATSTDQATIEVRDRATGERLLRSEPDDLRFQAIAVNAAHRRVVACGDTQAIRCWDLDTGDEMWTVRGHSSWVKSARFAMDDAILACCADDERIHVWDRARVAPIHVLAGHAGHIRAVARSEREPDRLYSASDDRTAAAWDLRQGSMLGRFEPHDGAVWAVASSPASALVATGTLRGTVTIWSPTTRDQLCAFPAHDGAVRSLSFDGSGRRLVSGGDDRRVRVWTIDQVGDRTDALASFDGHQNSVWCVAFTRVGRSDLVVSGSMDGTARVWHVGRRREVAVLRGHEGPVWAVVMGRGGELVLTGGSDHTIRAWRIPWSVRRGLTHKSLRPEAHSAAHRDWVRSLDLSLDERLVLSGSHDGTVGVWGADLAPVASFPVLRPYEGVDVTGVKGLSRGQLESLAELGASTSGA